MSPYHHAAAIFRHALLSPPLLPCCRQPAAADANIAKIRHADAALLVIAASRRRRCHATPYARYALLIDAADIYFHAMPCCYYELADAACSCCCRRYARARYATLSAATRDAVERDIVMIAILR